MTLFTTYGNCQADVLANLLTQSRAFSERYQFARLPPCFAVTENQVSEWASTSAPDVRLFIYQKLRKGWRASVEKFDTEWLATQCAVDVKKFDWSDMYYTAYEPHMTYPITFPRRKPSDYINLLQLITYANNIDWRILESIYTDPSIFPFHLFEMAHAHAMEELSRREADCAVKIAPFIDKHWREERLFLTFNHPGRRVVRHAANQVLEGLGIADRVPEKGYFGFLAASALPLLASIDAMLLKPEYRKVEDSFFLSRGPVSIAEYFDSWNASLEEIGRERIRVELVAQARKDNITHDFLGIVTRRLNVMDI